MLEVVFSKDKPAAGVVKVIPMFEKQAVKADFLTADEAKLVKKAIAQAGFDGQAGNVLDVFGGRAKIVLAGIGSDDGDLSLQRVGEKLFGKLSGDERAYIAVENDNTAIQLAYGILLGSYSFDKYKTEKTAADFPKLEQIIVRVNDPTAATENFKACLALVTAVRYAKDLCNEPASYLTPEVFAADIKRLEYLGLDVEILDEQALRLNGFGLVEAAARGSAVSPRVVVISWRGKRQQENYDLGLVGKGVCFDAGGLSLKNTAGMQEMKMDMSGAAAVVAAMKAAALQRRRKNLIAVVGLIENMPGPAAMKIGDVCTSVCGKTVEIGNADAEGRLVVADCLAYLQKNYPVKRVVDLATLGSLRNVLGNVYAGLFANDDKLAEALLAAGDKSGEKLWKMPLDIRYEQMLSSPIADIRNVAVEGRASIVSAAFLNRFVEKGVKWAHIDISGVRLDKTGLASGFGVRLLDELIKEL